ncbi:MAG TPA: DUF72 domain-containing protein, partial [Myxococcales bacterium]|nr:DUF72 domain-containing protein [Myxococcales bacterium]
GFRYLRFHGATGRYDGRYGARALRPAARSLTAFGGDAYVYFNNDRFGHALRDAMDLASLLASPHAVRSERGAPGAAGRRSEAGEADGSLHRL